MRPLFLLGAARSGTTLLYKLLCLNPDAAFISNWVRRWPALLPLAGLNRLARRLPSLEMQLWFGQDSNAYAYGRSRPLLERVFPAPVEGEPLFARCGIQDSGPAEIDEDTASQCLRGTFQRILKYSGGRALVSKRISNNRRIGLLNSAFPDARYVVLTRDGRAVANSLSRVDWWPDSVVWWYGGTPRDWQQEGRDPWELCARNWVEEVHSIEAGLSLVPEASVLRLRYEDFLGQPGFYLRQIAAFAGLRLHRDWLEQVSQLKFPNRNQISTAALDPETYARIERIQRVELERFAYLSPVSER